MSIFSYPLFYRNVYSLFKEVGLPDGMPVDCRLCGRNDGTIDRETSPASTVCALEWDNELVNAFICERIGDDSLCRCTVGSPWRIDVRSPARVSVNSSGLHQMSVGKVAVFELQSTDPDSDITVNVTRMYTSD